ncbi:MAG: hypothetical protein DRO99_03800 [Candidatus Aenigmatarchaeota archaeon]|nr:MAG: hypothetical protein DRO99_03800 [Candidatus Aenigmarchaeota archaeon]
MVNIDSVSFGEINIDGKTYYSDMIVWWDGKVEFISKNHIFGMDQFAKLMQKEPKIIVIGTGEQGSVKILPEVEQVCSDKGIKLYSDPTQKAADFFNGLVMQGKKVAGYFHVTG